MAATAVAIQTVHCLSGGVSAGGGHLGTLPRALGNSRDCTLRSLGSSRTGGWTSLSGASANGDFELLDEGDGLAGDEVPPAMSAATVTAVVSEGKTEDADEDADEPMGILGQVLKQQVQVLSSSLWKVGQRSFWLQAFFSTISFFTLWLSAMMQRSAFHAAEAGWPRVAALRGAVGEGLVAAGLSLGISVVHMVWSLSFARAGTRVVYAAKRCSPPSMHQNSHIMPTRDASLAQPGVRFIHVSLSSLPGATLTAWGRFSSASRACGGLSTGAHP